MAEEQFRSLYGSVESFFTVGGDDFLIPVIGIFRNAVQCAAVFIFFSVNVDKAVALLIAVEPAEYI